MNGYTWEIDLEDWDWLGQPMGVATQVLDHLDGLVSLTNANWAANFKNCAAGSFVSSNGIYTLTVTSVGTNGSGECTPVVGQALAIATGSPELKLRHSGDSSPAGHFSWKEN